MSNKSDNFLANLHLFGIMLILCSLFVPAFVEINSDAQAKIWLYGIGIGLLYFLLPLFLLRNK
jgi:hypothetical protein